MIPHYLIPKSVIPQPSIHAKFLILDSSRIKTQTMKIWPVYPSKRMPNARKVHYASANIQSMKWNWTN